MPSDGPLAAAADDVAVLRTILEGAGYTERGVSDALATDVATSREAAEIPLYVRLLPPDERLSTLIQLFLLGVTVPDEAAARALAPMELGRLAWMGLVTSDAGRTRPEVEIVPVDDLLVTCDGFGGELSRPDHVLGISPPAKVLAALTVRKDVRAALDLGTGNGLQALLAARHAERVVATDITSRAASFARFNALLNGVSNIDVRTGNLFEPVDGETFDLIVSNPPYVISPETSLVYRDSGVRGDVFCEGLVRTLPAHLRDAGFALVLVSWLHGPDDDWSEPLRGWVEGSGCDAVLLRYATHEPLDYAAGWNRPLRPQTAAYAEALDRWHSYFRSLGDPAISWGAVVLRRRDGTNWVWSYSPTSQRITAASNHVLRLFDAQDFLASLTDPQDLLDSTLALTGDHLVERSGRIADEGFVTERTVLRLDRGLSCEVSIDEATSRVIALLDGNRRTRDAFAAVTTELPSPPSLDVFAARALPVVRRLVELGFLVPEADRGARTTLPQPPP